MVYAGRDQSACAAQRRSIRLRPETQDPKQLCAVKEQDIVNTKEMARRLQTRYRSLRNAGLPALLGHRPVYHLELTASVCGGVG